MSEELHAKYQKLATAYAEVKQKNAVLKSAVQELTQKQGQGSAAAGWFGLVSVVAAGVLCFSPRRCLPLSCSANSNLNLPTLPRHRERLSRNHPFPFWA